MRSPVLLVVLLAVLLIVGCDYHASGYGVSSCIPSTRR